LKDYNDMVIGESIPELIKIVQKSDDGSLRREAIIELGYKENKAIYPVLLECLNDSSNSIRHAAVISLGRYGQAEAIEELVKSKIFQSPVVNIRWAVVSAIAKLGDYHVIEHLLKAVADPEWIVRNQAVTELKGKIKELIKTPDVRNIRILVRLLALDDEEIVDLATGGLVECGGESIERILEAMKSPSISMRANAVYVLGQMRAVQVLDILIDKLQDPEWRVRRRAVEALGLIRNKKAVEPLVRSLADNVERVQREAIKALFGYGKLSTDPILNALSHEKNKFILRAMLITLGKVGDPRAIPDLVIHLRSSYFVVRIAAVRALIRYGSQVVESLLPTLSYNESDITGLLKDTEKVKDTQIQLRAIKALGGLEDHRAVSRLKDLVDKGNEEVKDAAANALYHIGCAAWGRCSALIVLRKVGDRSLIRHIVHSLGDDSDNVRLEAVKALAEINGSKSINPLIEMAKSDRDPYIRFEVLRQLRRVGVGYNQVLDLGLFALKDSSRDVRSQAAWLLGNFQDKRSILPLLKATADPHWSVRESAENALLNFGNKSVPYLLDALRSRSWTTRFRVSRLLGEIGDVRAMEPLEKILRKKSEHKEVIEVVKQALDKLKMKKQLL